MGEVRLVVCLRTEDPGNGVELLLVNNSMEENGVGKGKSGASQRVFIFRAGYVLYVNNFAIKTLSLKKRIEK